MKVTKRCISLLLALTLILSVLPMGMFTATAQEIATDAVITVKNSYGKGGATVAVDVVIQNNPGILGMTLTLTYDESALTLTGVTNGDAMSALTFTAPKEFKSGVNLPWDAESISEEDIKDGVIATLTFEISETAQLNSRVPVEVSYDAGAIVDNDLNSLSVLLSPGYIQVLDYTPGDLNDNGIVDTTDVVLLRRYIAGGYGVTIVENAADVNDDGKRNTTDAVLIRRYIAGGYGVELLPVSPKCDHTMEHTPYKAPTCTEEGNVAYWYCSTCKKYFNDEVGTAELTEEQRVIPLGDHTYSTEWSYDATYHWHGATCEHTDSVSDRAEHSFDSDKSCIVCGYSSAEDPTKPYTITYKLVEYNQLQGDTYLLTLSIDNSMNPTGFSSTKEEPLYHPTCGGAYRFCGWYTALVGGELVEKIPVGTTKDVTLYARWEENVFDITYRVSDTPVDPVSPESEAQYLTYRPSKGLADLPSRDPDNYIFLGWYKEDGTKVNSIPVGSTGDIVLIPQITSKRNLARGTELKDPLIIEDTQNGIILFAYELGTIENVPLTEKPIWSIESVAGLSQQKSQTVTTSIENEYAQQITEMISNSTVDSSTWTLSENWSDTVEINETWAKNNELRVEEAEEMVRTDTNSISLTNSHGVTDTTSHTNGVTTKVETSVDQGRETGSHFDVNVDTKFTNSLETSLGFSAGLKIPLGDGVEGNAGVDAGIKNTSTFEVGMGAEYGNYEKNTINTHVGTEQTAVDTTVEEKTLSWNSSVTSDRTEEISRSSSISSAFTEVISKTKGYGQSYTTGGEGSNAVGTSVTESTSTNSASTLVYVNTEITEKTETYSSDGRIEGEYRLILAGTVHVFAVVGYDVSTGSYFTYTYNILDDNVEPFLDYTPKGGNFTDHENSVLPFEVPYFVHEYVMEKTTKTEGLQFKTNSADRTATISDYSGDSVDVIVPSYISAGGSVYKVTGIEPNAFAGDPIQSVHLSDHILYIPEGAFKDCTQLKQISGRFTKIGAEAFSGCTGLENFIISPAVSEIGREAFAKVPTVSMTVLNEEWALIAAEELHPEITSNNEDELRNALAPYGDAITKKVIQEALDSGAGHIVIDLAEVKDGLALNFDVPEISKFELYGDNRKFNELTVSSYADTTALHKITIQNAVSIPLDIHSQELVLDTVTAESPSFALLLSKPNVKITLVLDSKMTGRNGKTIVSKSPEVVSTKTDGVVGTLNVSGNFYYCGTRPDETCLCFYDGSLVPISEEEFGQYIQGEYIVSFDANEGVLTGDSQKTVYLGQKYNTLPTATRDYYTFEGWYTAAEGGELVTVESVFDDTSITTLYAHWTLNPVSGWVRASDLPAGAEVVDRKWTYTLTTTTESTETSLSGYTPIGSYWVRSGGGSTNYASFPSGFDTGNSIYTSFSKSAYSDYEYETTKREVSNSWAGYVYWHWMYNVNYANRTDRTIADKKCTYNNKSFQYFFAMTSTVDCAVLSSGYVANYVSSKAPTTYNCHSILPASTSSTDGLGTPRMLRFSYYTSTYTDYYKMFQYQKVEAKESTTDPTGQSGVSEVVEWVQYREK